MKNSVNDNSHLAEMSGSDFTPAKGEPDIRGWLVKNNQMHKLGKVADLIIDSEIGKVRYLVLDLKINEVQLQPHQVLIPIGLAELDTSDDIVILPQITADQLQALPTYEKGNLNREMELAVQQAFTQSHAPVAGKVSRNQANGELSQDFYDNSHYNYANMYNGRKAQTVIGLFNTVPSAQAAVQQLEKANINRDKIELVTRYAPQNNDLVKVDNAQDAYDRFFFSLFSSRSDATANLEAARNSNAIVAVYTSTPEETRVASAILQENNTAANDKAPQPMASETNPGNLQVPVAATTANQESSQTLAGTSDDRNRIVDRPVGELIRRREQRGEHLLGNPTNGAANFASFRPGVIELVEYTEVPVIRKEARVLEEVSIQKLVEEHEGIIQDSVRHTEIDVQNLNPNNTGLNR